ncbi:hypothetical protein D9C73_001306 [Collichthys lucidus]|uniref:Uncharacterized protein n=1 Tax=Collichthys lucidus TaxID=240159 RepID=A0A4U5U0R9_COLLU|nr:hypothetical protein D9C73_001306 [Collichthys lucidus]
MPTQSRRGGNAPGGGQPAPVRGPTRGADYHYYCTWTWVGVSHYRANQSSPTNRKDGKPWGRGGWQQRKGPLCKHPAGYPSPQHPPVKPARLNLMHLCPHFSLFLSKNQKGLCIAHKGNYTGG